MTQTGSLARQSAEQRFRASVISSTAVHVGTLLIAIFGPALWPEAVLMPDVVPVTILQLPPAPATPPPAAAQPEQEQEVEAPEPEPDPIVEAVETEPEAIPQNLEQLRRDRDEERRLQDEAERQRQLEQQRERERREAERRRREQEEAERRREEEEERQRRQPQKAGRRPDPTPQRQEAQRQGITFTGAETDDQSFTVEDFPFSYYVATIRDKVSAKWSPPARGAYAAERRVVVHFRIGRDGRIVQGPDVDATSGDTLFDQAARRAVASAAPFPPLPREYAGQSLGVRFAFVQE